MDYVIVHLHQTAQFSARFCSINLSTRSCAPVLDHPHLRATTIISCDIITESRRSAEENKGFMLIKIYRTWILSSLTTVQR
jgi:hypothetical protein